MKIHSNFILLRVLWYLALKLRTLVHFELISLYDVKPKSNFIFFPCEYPTVPYSLLKRLLEWTWHSCQKSNGHGSVDLVLESPFFTIGLCSFCFARTHCFEHCSFVINFEFGTCEFLFLFLLFNIVLVIQCPLKITYEFEGELFIAANDCWSSDINCVEASECLSSSTILTILSISTHEHE